MTIMTMPAQTAMVKVMGGKKPLEWVGQCHGAATALVGLLGPEHATVRRGYFVGETTPGAFFHGRPSQHSWVELRDGQVADPTRFAFVLGEPWPIWVGSDDDYDIGGCKSTAPKVNPPGSFDADTEIHLEIQSAFYVADLLGLPPEFWGDADEENDTGYVALNMPQLFWLANLPIKDYEGPGVLARHFAAEVYEAIYDAGHSVAIPIDRRDWILPERSEGRSSW